VADKDTDREKRNRERKTERQRDINSETERQGNRETKQKENKREKDRRKRYIKIDIEIVKETDKKESMCRKHMLTRYVATCYLLVLT